MDELRVSPDDKTYYVGDEYEIDVIGARNAGLVPILIDRNNNLPFADCLRFNTLSQMCIYLGGKQGGI
jgi:FMN phosphatase YigB (HAD superfamily)